MSDLDRVLAWSRSTVDRDFGESSAFAGQIDDVDPTFVARIVALVFYAAVRERFEDRTGVVDFIDAERERFPDIDPGVMEAAIRAALGEEELLEQVGADEVLRAEVVLTYVLLGGYAPDVLDAFYAGVRDLVGE